MNNNEDSELEDFKVCPICGGKLFYAYPGEITQADIVEFQNEMKKKGILFAEHGWLHHGIYCYECEWGILIEMAIAHDEEDLDERDCTLVLDSYGPNMMKVVLIIKRYLGVSPSRALEIVRSVPVVILENDHTILEKCTELMLLINNAGGVARLERKGDED